MSCVNHSWIKLAAQNPKSMAKSEDGSCPFPLLVHCSAGIGRTGTYVMIHTVVSKFLEEGISIDKLMLRPILSALRDQRPGLVQHKDQYQFCYQVIRYVISGGIHRELANLGETGQRLLLWKRDLQCQNGNIEKGCEESELKLAEKGRKAPKPEGSKKSVKREPNRGIDKSEEIAREINFEERTSPISSSRKNSSHRSRRKNSGGKKDSPFPDIEETPRKKRNKKTQNSDAETRSRASSNNSVGKINEPEKF